jgi:hypothetical protein
LLREDHAVTQRLLPFGATETIRENINARVVRKPSISTSRDLPLTDESKKVLSRAAAEADELKHRSIGTGHLVLALLGEKSSFAAEFLEQQGTDYAKAREFVSQFEFYEERHGHAVFTDPQIATSRRRPAAPETTIRIHNMDRDLEFIRAGVRWCRGVLWHWTRKVWQAQDIVVQRSDGRVSFDLSLAKDTAKFLLVHQGWKHDACAICGWRLYASPELEHSTGYTNGRVWVCMECFDKFLQDADYFTTSHPEIT